MTPFHAVHASAFALLRRFPHLLHIEPHALRIHPRMFFVLALLLFFAGTLLGSHLRLRQAERVEKDRDSFKTLESATLALLGLLLGFTFSMAVGRYDLRKQLEVSESTAVGSAWLRTTTLSEPARTQEQTLLRQYVPVRLEFLNAGTSTSRIEKSLEQTEALQRKMWAIASEVADAQPNPISAAFLESLNQSIDFAEKRTSAFENRIPPTAWAMLLFIGFVSSVLVGVGFTSRSHLLRLVLPVVVAAALSLTLDLDSPRSGFIHEHQHSLDRLAQIVAGPVP